MDERTKRKLARQLNYQAELFRGESDEKVLIRHTLATCQSLLQSVDLNEVSQATRQEMEMFQAGYQAMVSLIMNFCQEAERFGMTTESQEHSIQMLEAEVQRVAASRSRLDELAHELEAKQNTNQILTEEIEKKEEELQEVKTFYQSLKKREENFTEEKIAAQKEENEKLFSEIITKKETMDSLTGKRKEYLDKKKELEKSIQEAEKEIGAIPEENKKLLKSCEEKKELLRRLSEAKEECSQKKQNELQEEIDKLVPVVEELESNYTILKERMDALNDRKMSYDKETEELSSNIVTIFQESFTELMKASKEHEDVLREIKKNADTLSEKIAACTKMRAEYADWFGTVQTPLEAMITAAERPEFAELRKTLDIGEIEVVKNLFQGISHNINELEGILEKCVAASRKDQKNLVHRAGS